MDHRTSKFLDGRRFWGTVAIWIVLLTGDATVGMAQPTMRPHLFLTAEPVEGLRSVAEFRRAVGEPGLTNQLWQKLLTQAEADRESEPVTPATFRGPHRNAGQVAIANPDYWVCRAAGQRILRNALAGLVTGDPQYRDVALRQIQTLFDVDHWPDWRDKSHRQYPADLRSGSLGRDVAIAYDWMHSSLSPAQRHFIVEGLDRHAIQPFWKSVQANVNWVNGHHNWTTCIVGGLGIVGMALTGDHEDAERLVSFSRPRMSRYLTQYGRDGEFNESVGYSLATRLPVTYFSALNYATLGKENRLNGWPFVPTSIWNAYTYLPPGRLMAFGDGDVERPAETAYFATVAAASQNPLIQWFYANSPQAKTGMEDELPLWLLGYDPRLIERSPNGALPLGRAFQEHAAIMVSRTSWNLDSTECVVYGKAGIVVNHEHHDAGQLCIDSRGQRLIVDLGSPSTYPADFFGDKRWNYYNASWTGHNVLTIDGQQMKAARGTVGKILATEFNDRRGGYWQLDLTELYQDASHVKRTVAHCLPGIVAVVDDAAFPSPQNLSLRWHTADKATPNADGSFVVVTPAATLTGRVVHLQGPPLTTTRGQHQYEPPFETARTGAKLEQRHESFIHTRVRGKSTQIMTLFAVLPADSTDARWEANGDGYRIRMQTGTWQVSCAGNVLRAANQEGVGWTIPLK